MFENNPVVAAFGIIHHLGTMKGMNHLETAPGGFCGKSESELLPEWKAIEWDVFFDESLMNKFGRIRCDPTLSKSEKRTKMSEIGKLLCENMLISHGSGLQVW